ncbi:MAG: hypothetical protein MUC99_01695 [Anaerolineae bacterium]|nr:hypothetical protein [Anaerolineae bacterium]
MKVTLRVNWWERSLMNAIRRMWMVLAACVVAVVPTFGQDAPPATVINDEGGPVVITGSVTYTNPFFTIGSAAPLIILEDQAGFVDRNKSYLFPPESQALGQITSDFYTSPFTYSLSLPIEPRGGLRDVDQDGQTDAGVMVFAVAYWENVWGDPFLEERDMSGGGWSTAYASTVVSEDPELLREVVGGKMLVFAPDVVHRRRPDRDHPAGLFGGQPRCRAVHVRPLPRAGD